MAIFHGYSVGSDRDDFRQEARKKDSIKLYIFVCVWSCVTLAFTFACFYGVKHSTTFNLYDL